MEVFIKWCIMFSSVSIMIIVYIIYKIESDVRLRIKRWKENQLTSINNVKLEDKV